MSSEYTSDSLYERVRHELAGLRSFIQADGGDVELVSIENGVVKVRFTGACVHCPISLYTVKFGLEARLKEAIAGITSVEQVD